MSMQLILGTDVIFQGTLTCDKNSVKITKTLPTNIFVNCTSTFDDAIKSENQSYLSPISDARCKKGTLNLNPFPQDLTAPCAILERKYSKCSINRSRQ